MAIPASFSPVPPEYKGPISKPEDFGTPLRWIKKKRRPVVAGMEWVEETQEWRPINNPTKAQRLAR